MNNDVVNLAKDKQFSKFSDAVKDELASRIAKDPRMTKHKTDSEKIADVKALFAKASQVQEPEKAAEPEKVEGDENTDEPEKKEVDAKADDDNKEE